MLQFMIKFTTCLSLFNLLMMIALIINWRKTSFNPRSSSVHDTTVDTGNGTYIAADQPDIKLFWRREELPTQQRKFLFNPDAAKVVKPNVPLLHFTQAEMTMSTAHTNAGFNFKSLYNFFLQQGFKNQAVEAKVSKQDIFHTEISDVYFSLRITFPNHHTRIKRLLDTWVSVAVQEVVIATDVNHKFLKSVVDEKFETQQPQIIETACPQSFHNKWRLLCMTYWEFQHFLYSKKKKQWFCHFNDDTYVNVKALIVMLKHFDPSLPWYIGRSPSKSQFVVTRSYFPATINKPQYLEKEKFYEEEDTSSVVAFNFALDGAGYCISNALAHKMEPMFQGSRLIKVAASISLPDDCVMGYIITHLLNVSLVDSEIMHSQFEDTTSLTSEDLLNQATFRFSQLK